MKARWEAQGPSLLDPGTVSERKDDSGKDALSPSRGRAVLKLPQEWFCTSPAQLHYPNSHHREKTGSTKGNHFQFPVIFFARVEFNERLQPELSLVLGSFLKHQEICYHHELKTFLQRAALKFWPQTPNLPGFGHNPVPDLPWIKTRGASFLTQFISISPWGCDYFTLSGRIFSPSLPKVQRWNLLPQQCRTVPALHDENRLQKINLLAT